MPIIAPAIRPPAEADSFLLQVTTGCSAQGCTFCGAYSGKPFCIKPANEICADIAAAAPIRERVRRVFLMDGDALVLDNARLLPVLNRLRESFPRITRIASYANDFNILNRTDGELAALHAAGLRLVYIGLESGSQAILDGCRKRSTVAGMVEAVHRAAAQGIKASVIVLLGLGGREKSAAHAAATAAALNRMQPRYLSFLSLMLIPGTPHHAAAAAGIFTELSPAELLAEAGAIIRDLELEMTVFRSDHASNYLSLEGRFPADKERLLAEIRAALAGGIRLRPEFLRGL